MKFSSPLTTLEGKEAVEKATCGYMNVIEYLVIRGKFGAGDQAVIVYDVDIVDVTKKFPASVLLDFINGQIIKVELFFDSAPFLEN